MPQMSGGELAKELAKLRADTRVLFVSGYAGQTVLNHSVADLQNNFLQKPFTLKQLAAKVRTVLDQGGSMAHVVSEKMATEKLLAATPASASVSHA
jgi:DNA-binding NtrC family response regulator